MPFVPTELVGMDDRQIPSSPKREEFSPILDVLIFLSDCCVSDCCVDRSAPNHWSCAV